MAYPWPDSEIRFSVSAEEDDAFARAAALAGQSVEGWVRSLCMRHAREVLDAEQQAEAAGCSA